MEVVAYFGDVNGDALLSSATELATPVARESSELSPELSEASPLTSPKSATTSTASSPVTPVELPLISKLLKCKSAFPL